MKWSREKDPPAVIPETDELLFGHLVPGRDSFREISKAASTPFETVVVDLRSLHAISRFGIIWLVDLLTCLRGRGFQPVVLCDPSWKGPLEETVLKKIVPIGQTLSFESEGSAEAVGDLEKDLLWESGEESPVS